MEPQRWLEALEDSYGLTGTHMYGLQQDDTSGMTLEHCLIREVGPERKIKIHVVGKLRGS